MTRTGTGRLRTLGLLLTALLLAVGVMGAISAPATAGSATANGSTAGATEATNAPTAARKAARRVNFGAIALNRKTGWSGWSYDKKTKKKAKKAAKRHCKKRSKRNGASPKGCKNVVWVRNGCAAVAVKIKNNQIKRVGWGVAFKKKKAQKIAKRKAGKKSKLHTFSCTTRYY